MVALVAGAVLDGIDRVQMFLDVLLYLLAEFFRCDTETMKAAGPRVFLKRPFNRRNDVVNGFHGSRLRYESFHPTGQPWDRRYFFPRTISVKSS